MFQINSNDTDSRPLVSVVLPCLNEARKVGRCVHKALASLNDCDVTNEVVVSDDGSTDGSPAIAVASGAHVVDCPTRGFDVAIQQDAEPP
jgi:glycosyltransferase involved in cell wall biosynthesis